MTFHIHSKWHPGSGPITAHSIRYNVSVETTNLVGYAAATRAMTNIFTCDIAFLFSQMWYTQVVKSGYLSSSMLPEVASFPRVPEAAQVFLSPLSPLAGRAGTPMSSTLYYQLSTPTHHQHFLPSSPIKSCQMAMIWMAITDSVPLVVKPSPMSSTTTLPSPMSSLSSVSSVSTLTTKPNFRYNKNIFQALLQEALDFLQISGMEGKRILNSSHIFFSMLDKWFAMLKNKFTNIDDGLLLLTMKQ